MMTKETEIVIDELIMDGPFGARNGAIREALGRHLERLAAVHGVARSLHLSRVTVDVSPTLGTDAIAAAIAEQLYGRIAGGTR